MTDSGLVDIPAGQSILPALAQKEYDLQQKIREAEAEAKARVEEARKDAQRQIAAEEEAIEQEEEKFLETGLAEARAKAEKVRQAGAAHVEELRARGGARIESAADVVVDLVVGERPE